MTIRVKLPNGAIAQFPDGTSPEDIQRAIQQQMAQGLPSGVSRRERVKMAGANVGSTIGPGRTFLREALPLGLGTLAATAGTLARGTLLGGNVAGEGPLGERADEALAAQRAQGEAMREANPKAALGGALTSGVITAVLARKPALALGQAASKVPALAPVARFLTGFKRGNLARNVAQLSALGATGGAAEGGVRGIVEQGEFARPAAVGAAFGTAGGPIGGAIASTVRVARRLLPASIGQGFRLLARRLLPKGADQKDVLTLADDLQKRADQFKDATGRVPRVAELLDEQAAAELNLIAQAQPRVGQVFREAELDAAAFRPRQISQTIEAGRAPAPTAREAVEARGKLFNDIIDPVREAPVRFTPKQARTILDDPDLRGALPKNLRARVDQAFSEAKGGDVVLRLVDVDDIRQALRSSAGEGKGAKGVFNELASEIRDFATDQIPEYGAALRTFGARSDLLRGLDEGRAILSPSGTREFIDTATKTAAPERVGVRAAARQTLSEAAAESPGRALSTTRDLAQNEGLFKRVVAALGGRQATEIRSAAQAELQGAQRLRQIAQGTRVPTGSEEQARAITETLQGVFAGQAGGAFRASFATKLIQQGIVPEVAARKVAEAITDPRRTAEAIARLRAAGVEVDTIANLVREAGVASGIVSGRLASEGEF